MRETITVTVLVEIEYDARSSYAAANRELAIESAFEHFTRDQPGDFHSRAGNYTVGRSRAIQARRTKQRIMPRKGGR